jgi:hypothetical protein
MGKREDNSDQDGHRDGYDHTRTKPVEEAGGGKHDKNDK